MFDPELESFKTSIDLRAYAERHGYVLDPKASWGRKDGQFSAAVMRHANGDKIVVARDGDGHYVYCSMRDDRDRGTIIDFVKHRRRLTLGAIRKDLRPWLSRHVESRPYPPLLPTTKDRFRVEKAYAGMQDAKAHFYLENERALPAALLQKERFAGRIRVDERANAIFPHFDAQGLCGYEMKNYGFTGFAPGGSKGLWLSHEKPDDTGLVICESAIDALSHALLFPEEHSRYASVGGQISPAQREVIRAAAACMPRDSKVIAATDSDEAGGRLAETIREAVELTGRDDIEFVRHAPEGFKDWNDQLRNRPLRGGPGRPSAPTVS